MLVVLPVLILVRSQPQHHYWLLFLLQEQALISEARLAKRLHVPAGRLAPSIEALLQKELVTTTSQVDGQGDDQLQLTPAGQETVDKLATAYHDSLAELLDGWSPEQEAELATLLHRVTTNLLSEKSTTALISIPA